MVTEWLTIFSPLHKTKHKNKKYMYSGFHIPRPKLKIKSDFYHKFVSQILFFLDSDSLTVFSLGCCKHHSGNFSIRFWRQYVLLFASKSLLFPLLTFDKKSSRWFFETRNVSWKCVHKLILSRKSLSSGNVSIRFLRQYMSLFTSIAVIVVPIDTVRISKVE